MSERRFLNSSESPDDNIKTKKLFKSFLIIWVALILLWFLLCPLLKGMVAHTIIEANTAGMAMMYYTTFSALIVVALPIILVCLFCTLYLEHIFDWIARKIKS